MIVTMPKPLVCECGACNVCKSRERMRRARIENPDRVRELDRQRYYRNREKRLKAQAAWRAANPDRMNELRKADADRNPERRRVYKLVQRALKSGAIVKPDACQECGSSAVKLHAHHDDYAKPLEVRWLCAGCHGRQHRGRRI